MSDVPDLPQPKKFTVTVTFEVSSHFYTKEEAVFTVRRIVQQAFSASTKIISAEVKL